MTYIAKPKLRHPGIPVNKLGFTHRDYEGSISTLCAGCGHDSISFAIIQACFELNIEPPSCRASAVPPRRRITSWAKAMASIRCMAACRRC